MNSRAKFFSEFSDTIRQHPWICSIFAIYISSFITFVLGAHANNRCAIKLWLFLWANIESITTRAVFTLNDPASVYSYHSITFHNK